MRIIYDNDAASDDITALIYLALHPSIIIEGITVAGTGEAHGLSGAKNLADVCYMLGKPDIKIAYGSEQPCSLMGKSFPSFIRKLADEELLNKNVPQNPHPNITDSAVELIRMIVEDSNEKITILATGPLTNIAEFVKKYPDLKNRIEKIVMMGGAVEVKGNIQAIDPESKNTVAEWNIYADPQAADIVFSSKIPVTLVSLDATNQVPMTKAFYDHLSQQLHPELKLIYQFLKDIVDVFGMDFFLSEFYLWDPLAAMICANPDIAITENIPILMDLQTAQTRPVTKDTEGVCMITVATKIQNSQFILQNYMEELKSNLINAKLNKSGTSNFFQSIPRLQREIIPPQNTRTYL